MEKRKTLIEFLLEREGILIPVKITNDKMIEALENALSTGNPTVIAETFKKISDNLEEYINKAEIIKLGEEINNIDNFYANQKIYPLTEDDKRIINFLVNNNEYGGKDFLELIGPLMFLLDVTSELEKNKESMPRILFISSFLFIFVLTYELLLHQIDRRAYYYLKNNPSLVSGKVKNFFNKNRDEYLAHAMTKTLNEAISVIVNLPEDNHSIFGEKSEQKIIRNKISHLNIFYDSVKDEIVVGNKTYSMQEFTKAYYSMFSFLLEWVKRSTGSDATGNLSGNFLDKTICEMKKSFSSLYHVYLEVGRVGEATKNFMSFIIKLKKDSALESHVTENIVRVEIGQLDWEIQKNVNITEFLIKQNGTIWEFHRYDKDPFPSNPHGHNKETGEKLNIYTGEKYDKNKVFNGKLTKKKLLDMQEKLKNAGFLLEK